MSIIISSQDKILNLQKETAKKSYLYIDTDIYKESATRIFLRLNISILLHSNFPESDSTKPQKKKEDYRTVMVII